jgi:hypothetical protein
VICKYLFNRKIKCTEILRISLKKTKQSTWLKNKIILGWDIAAPSERCASVRAVGPRFELQQWQWVVFCSDLLWTVRGSSMRTLIVVDCLLCYTDNTLCSQRLEPPSKAG